MTDNIEIEDTTLQDMGYTNTGVEAKVVLSSNGPIGQDAVGNITTVEAKFHRFILPELSKHRVQSQSASSSRALGLKKVINQVTKDPAMPVYWGKNIKGKMVAQKQLSEDEIETAEEVWLEARDHAVERVLELNDMELAKELGNRLLEPWVWQTMTITATNWQNFFNLRIHKDAQPEMCVLAHTIQQAMRDTLPEWVAAGQWHMPYLSDRERELFGENGQSEILRKVSIARCARTSYLGPAKTVEEELGLFERLTANELIHAVPMEHVARPQTQDEYKAFANWMAGDADVWSAHRRVEPPANDRNFHHWVQYRDFYERSRKMDTLS